MQQMRKNCRYLGDMVRYLKRSAAVFLPGMEAAGTDGGKKEMSLKGKKFCREIKGHRIQLILAAGLTVLVTACLAGCAGSGKAQTAEADSLEADGLEAETGEIDGQTDFPEETGSPVIGLILFSRDGEENESVIADMSEMAETNGLELLIYTPDVSEEEAEAAGGMETGTFIIRDVDPIEYQMMGVNWLVSENADVIAVHASHRETLEGVLSAARGVGIQICAWGQELTEGSFDLYVENGSVVPEAVLELLGEN